MNDDLLCSVQSWDYVEQPEIILVHSAQSGNLEAFNALVLKYQDLMYRTALRILGQEALAEDATQDTFISAYEHMTHFRGGSLKAWLMRILVNKCYDDIRRMQRTAALSLDGSLTDDGENESLYDVLQDYAPSIEECVEACERNEFILKRLNKLPASYRVILALIDIGEMSYGEASTILKIPLGTVKSRLARARLYLRKELKVGKDF